MSDSEPDNPFHEWGNAWRQDEAPVIEDIEARITRRLRLASIQTTTELCVASGGTLLGLWFLIARDTALGLATLLFAGISLLLVLDYRRRDRQWLTEPVDTQLETLYRLEQGRYRRGWVGVVVSLLAIGFLAFLVYARFEVQGFGFDFFILAMASLGILIGLAVVGSQIVSSRRACKHIRSLLDAE